MNFLLTTFKGKLTYSLAVVGLGWAVIGFITGNLNQESALQVVWLSLGLFGIRRAVQ